MTAIGIAEVVQQSMMTTQNEHTHTHTHTRTRMHTFNIHHITVGEVSDIVCDFWPVNRYFFTSCRENNRATSSQAAASTTGYELVVLLFSSLCVAGFCFLYYRYWETML